IISIPVDYRASYNCRLRRDRTNLHPPPLKPRKSRPQSHRIGICGLAQYNGDGALRHFRF
ncbi:hypothetical protein C7B67_25400, partial [filamentous cyanobacterium Phorm 6]